MKWKITGLIMVLIFALCIAGFASAKNDTLDDVESSEEDVEIEDVSNYIQVISISNGKIEFSDGFIGFCIDSSKNAVEKDDTFTQAESNNSEIENYIKLAIIEAYKQKKESDLGEIVSKIAEGNLNTNDEVIKEIAGSWKSVKASETVNIDNSTEATFDFELLKSTDSEKSDCVAYKVSFKTVKEEDVLGSEDTSTEDSIKEDSSKDKTQNNVKKTEDTNSKEDVKKENQSEEVKNNTKQKTVVNETNTTIKNKTNTVITIENNTTIIHKNNVNEVNNTTPEDNGTSNIMQVAGNPIFILIVVVAVAIAAVVIMRRKE